METPTEVEQTPCETWPLSAGALQQRYLDEVFRYVSRRIPQRQDAEDITAEVFAAAFEGLARFRGQCSPRAWLLGIARRKVVDALRRGNRRRERAFSEMEAGAGDEDLLERISGAAPGPDHDLQRAESRRMIREIVSGLREDQREALLLHYVEGLPIAEVGAALGRSTAAANSLLQRARAAVYRQGGSYFLCEAANEGGRKP